MYPHTEVESIIEHIVQLQPDWVIVDSIQTVYTTSLDASPGSMVQLKESTFLFQKICKHLGIPMILIGHINKEGAIAGPKALEHIVDTVIHFEGDRSYNYRMLRSVKNRFGSTMEIGFYEMQKQGMVAVKNPSELLLTSRGKDIIGTSVGCINEGMRTFFVEVQALVTPSYYSTPQRTVNGVEHRKVQLICAVLEKICKLQLGNKDIFITLVGGIKTSDPAVDLSIAIAIISSYYDVVIPSTFCFSGELSLSGEIRSVTRIEQRINEAMRTGFHTLVCSSYNFKEQIEKKGIRLYLVKELEELISLLKK